MHKQQPNGGNQDVRNDIKLSHLKRKLPESNYKNELNRTMQIIILYAFEMRYDQIWNNNSNQIIDSSSHWNFESE